MTDRLTGLLKMRDISCEGIHGDIQQRVREKTLQRFRNGELRVLVATDVAARGLDIDDVDAVFNYDVPDENEYYIHRIGRTGRARRRGAAYTLVSTITESIRLDDIRKNTGNEIRAVRFNGGGGAGGSGRERVRKWLRPDWRARLLDLFACFLIPLYTCSLPMTPAGSLRIFP